MKNIKFVAVLFCAFSIACSSAENSPQTADKRSSSSTETGGGGGGRLENEDGNGSGSGNGSGKSFDKAVAQVSLNQAEQTQAAPVVAAERKIIRNAEIELEANAPEESQAKITQIAEANGGFVVESTQSGGGAKSARRDGVTMTVRVPSAKFDAALTEIRQTASRVIVESIKGQDVTEEFIDIEARLRTQKALETQFLEIMKRTNSVADALNVQTEIARVRGEIEKIEGRKRFLESQASLSTIKIELNAPTAFSSNSSGFFGQLAQAFGTGFDAALIFILYFVKFLIALLPFLILVVLPIYLLIRYLLKKSRKQKLASEIARDEIRTK